MATLEELRARQAEIDTRLREIHAESKGEKFNVEQRDEWNALNDELVANEEHIHELEARQARLEELASRGSVESEQRTVYSRGNKKSRVPDDPTDLMAYRQTASNIDDLHDAYMEGALRLNEKMMPANFDADIEKSQERVDKLLRYVDSHDDPMLAKRIIATSSSVYQRAFGKKVKGDYCSPEEERALSLTTTAGGFAVPYTLDPTIILTSSGVINPVRQFARIETITGNHWIGVSSAGVTASYSAEATEASDDAPTLAQPAADVEKAQAFIPFSIEIGGDWGSLQSEMARLLQDAKDTLENTQFLTGLGHSSQAPQGLLVGATAAVTSASTAVLGVADIYSLELALQPRSRARGVFVGNKAVYQKIRQFDTAGGANLWVQLQYGEPATLIGYPAYEWSAYSSAVTTTGSTVLTFGDFSKFLIIDRVGMDIELVPHLFGTANNRPTGQRGLYAHWRNTSYVLQGGVSRLSAFQSLKLL
jgi:HK97 family phage major capsid protein